MLGGPKKCGKCDKLVYPVEELKCLDKVWHKLCFKCTTCNTVLNMKNYKGFDKQPYCSTHYPQQKHTVVTDNPEMQRMKENTKIQSNIKYHEDFEKTKTKFTPVADTLETQRLIENQKNVSAIEYKGMRKNSEQNAANVNSTSSTMRPVTYKAGEKQVEQSNVGARKIGSIADYDPMSFENVPKSQSNGNGAMLRGVTTTNASNNFTNTGSVRESQLEDKIDDWNTSVFRAIYDHDANEDDEVSFRDGDRFINCERVDVGWMVGVHEKTGKYGFFPSNYVEPVNTL